MKLTSKRLREMLRYNKRTGIFTRIKHPLAPRFVGLPAGSLRKDGYVGLAVDKKSYLAHRLAWLYVTGEWPPELDHKNAIRSDNRWSNLRPATRSLNRANASASKQNILGIKGVRLYRSGKFQARFLTLHLGYFDTVEQAKKAYIVAAKKHFGEFARAA